MLGAFFKNNAACLFAALATTSCSSLEHGRQSDGSGGDQTSGPKLLKSVQPDYPESLRGQIPGIVTIRFTVTREGKTINAVAVRSSDPLFTQASLAAVGKMRFRPARVDGRTVEREVTQNFVFSHIRPGGSAFRGTSMGPEHI